MTEFSDVREALEVVWDLAARLLSYKTITQTAEPCRLITRLQRTSHDALTTLRVLEGKYEERERRIAELERRQEMRVKAMLTDERGATLEAVIAKHRNASWSCRDFADELSAILTPQSSTIGVTDN